MAYCFLHVVSTFTHDKDSGCIPLSQKRDPVQYSSSHRVVAGDWCKPLLVFLSPRHKLRCNPTTWSIQCNYHRLLKNKNKKDIIHEVYFLDQYRFLGN